MHRITFLKLQVLCNTQTRGNCLLAQYPVGREHAQRREIFSEASAGSDLVVDLIVEHHDAAAMVAFQHPDIDQLINGATQRVPIDAEARCQLALRGQVVAWCIQVRDFLLQLASNLCV